jgi:preflagellin peptidase FlaK
VNQILDGVRILLCIIFLFYASWSDWKTREVSNKVWIVLGPLALALTAFQFLFFSSQPILLFQSYIFSFAVTSALAVTVFYAGGFGGADAKALMCIALALPVYPDHLLSQPTGLFSPLFPLTIFTNSVLLGALSVFYALINNLIWKVRNKGVFFDGLESESFGRKILALVSGYKVKLSKLNTGHLYPLEDVEVKDDGEIKRKLLIFPRDEEGEEIISRLVENLQEEKIKDGIWATPGLPLLIFITAGLFVSLVYGDIVWILLISILG